MSGYLSNILTNTTSKYNTLRRNLLSDEVDGDTEDDSHLCRALRAYYTEQGKTFPQWLPADPKRPAPMQPTTSYTSSLRPQASNPSAPGSPAVGRSGGLSDLWDDRSARAPSPQPMSLRRAVQERTASYQGRGGSDSLAPPRPLPSQRAGSYQSSVAQQQYKQHGGDPSRPTSSSGVVGGGTAQERLKARLWGAARASSPGSPALGGGSMDRGGPGR